MGYNVGSLTRVPLEVYDHCIFVVGDPEINERAQWIQNNFTRLAQSLPPKTALVAGTNHQVSQEVLSLICEASEDDDGEGKGWRHFMFLADHTSLVISKGDIRKTNSPLILVPLGEIGGDADSDQFMGAVFAAVCKAVRDGRIDELIENLGAVHVPLRPFKPGMKVATLRRWNEVLDLKPNFAGIGLNLNAGIEHYLDDLELEGRPVKVSSTTHNSVTADAASDAGTWRIITEKATRLFKRLREMAKPT